MTVNKRSLEYKTIDPGFKTIVLPKILIKFDLKNITNTYIHKYKINFFEWPPVALGIKSLHAWPLLVYMASFPNLFLLRQSHWPAFCSSSTMLRFLIHRIWFSSFSQLTPSPVGLSLNVIFPGLFLHLPDWLSLPFEHFHLTFPSVQKYKLYHRTILAFTFSTAKERATLFISLCQLQGEFWEPVGESGSGDETGRWEMGNK